MKAKRIISFCSLFSLVLILSIYYILSPINEKTQTVSNINDGNNSEVVVEITDGESAYFENLEVLKQSTLNQEIKDLEAIIASGNTTSEEKLEALVSKHQKMKMNENEKKLANIVKEKGYDNVYVEYEDKSVNILVAKKDSSRSDALTIMRAVYPNVEVGYTPLVIFKG